MCAATTTKIRRNLTHDPHPTHYPRSRWRCPHRRDAAGRRRRSSEAHHRPARQLGHRDLPSRQQGRHLQEAWPRARDDLHGGLGRDPAAGDRRQRRSRPRGRHARRDRGLLEGRAGAHHRGRGDRGRRLLVREGDLADQDAQGPQRPQHRLFHRRLLDRERRARLHQGERSHLGQAHVDRQRRRRP